MINSKPRTLDRIDLTILDILQKNGRISNNTLAQHVNLSASPCLERVKRLEQEGYIERYGAFLNASKLKCGMTAFIQVTLDRTTADIFNEFRSQVVQIKEVAECHMVVGGFDYLLKLRFENMEAYRILLGSIVDLPAVSQTHTYVVMEHVKRHSGIPIFD
ncbi:MULTISPECIES: winged helix-turn-helix transcriptional regulator [unclassified Colwellia]|jgi:Lrp/AsnC family leucine-responsive transcriptional regulator|uniref:winged helix-turn-helix transcriptional regulator n=1 Tax=unclassified Colwellia TaxID=196834 RepID=UPI000D348D83|nr:MULTISPECIES: winged helix-turn-helix transcriptional regulator [unclassified Colwellia]AWB58964.1 leucine-responsive transcriptional regulator [Colwellia sp. Arc7-D]MBA6414425.1 winged helix-turn-helix transcriptional regulator [Colwellia sp. 6M3]|tara:strand:- start:519 stop:998 length:480 start_codon:yes stop_codon:yes gene_type:complete